ncbi:MAG TPA: hypothetical protein VGG72_21555 [Bryobacteraceae bacterium]|jgi:hypothetical protein
MKTFGLILASALIFSTLGCDINQRLDRLEKDNQDLKSQIQKDQTVRDYDLQAKCSKDARLWFNENWQRDKNTIYLEFTNHYDKRFNTCMIEVEFHFNMPDSPQQHWWVNDMSVWNIYENLKLADFSEDHITDPTFTTAPRNEVTACESGGNKCTSLDQFNSMSNSYLSN